MRKNNVLFLLVAIAFIAVAVACSTTGGESIPATYEFTPGIQSGRQYEILGEVVLDGTIRKVLGVQTSSGKGYSDFLALAKSMYPDCDALINCYIDRSNTNVVISQSTTQIYRGTAVRYK